jgi:hypothetical protein
MGSTRQNPDKVDTDLLTAGGWQSFSDVEVESAGFRIPLLLRSSNPHERLYVAAQDGTGNNLFKDAPEHQSIVAKVHTQIDELNRQGRGNIASGYVEGIYTQDNRLAALIDGINGYTFERRVETAYHQFCEQAKNWMDEDPDSQIRVVGIGFSRGSEQTAALLRMIHDRGIQNPEGAKIVFDSERLITHAEYTRPPLVPPGRTLQAAVMIDPVDTGIREHDRRLPSSVVSVFQITATEERRDLFKASLHIPYGLSEDGRAYNARINAAHSNAGDTYTLNGVGTLSHNMVAHYLNALTDGPAYIQARALPEDPDAYRVHRSDQHAFFYTTRGYDRDGVRDHAAELGAAQVCRRDAELRCDSKDPMDPALEALIERRTLPVRLLPPRSEVPGQETERLPPQDTRSELDKLVDQLYDASRNGNDQAWTQALQSASRQFMASPTGQDWLRDVQAYDREQQHQQELRQAQEAQQQSLQREAPVRSMSM